jgi:hypothetical protein
MTASVVRTWTRRLPSAAVVAVVLILVAPTSVVAAATPAPWVVPARVISRDNAPNTSTSEPATQVEPSIAADPHDSRYVVSVFQQGRYVDGGAVALGYAHSSDGGLTWRSAMLPGLTTASGGPFERGSDAVVTFGPDGTVYANTLEFNTRDCRNGVAVQISHDHGATFRAPVFIADSSDCYLNSTDKNWITVDTNRDSPHFGRVYVMWDENNFDTSFNLTSVPMIERYTDNHGATWSGRVTVAGGLNADPVPLVEPHGKLVVVHNIQDPVFGGISKVAANISTDGGRTFGPTVTIASVLDGGPIDVRYGGLVAAAVDPSSGTLYATWSDATYNINLRNDVLLSRSVDGGRTWSMATKVDQEGKLSQVDHLTPMVAASGGNVYVTYLVRDEADPSRVHMVITASHDSGRRFGPVIALGPTSTLAYAAFANGPGVAFLGDYTGLTLANGRIYLAWEVASKPPPTSTWPLYQVTWAEVLPQWTGQPIRSVADVASPQRRHDLLRRPGFQVRIR